MIQAEKTEEILDLLTEISEQLMRQNQLIVLGATFAMYGGNRAEYLARVKDIYASDTDE